jgi:thiamine-phosphate pyrophosphorylase
MALSRLYFVTMEGKPLEQIEAVCRAGIRLVQLRMKEASDEEFLETAREAMRICVNWGSRLIVNDRVEVAAAVGAHGVHVGKEDLPVREARRLLGAEKIVGGTANTMEDIREHAAGGADYVGLGPYRFTTTKKKLSPILGLEGFRGTMAEMATLGVTVPVFAIGGIGVGDVGTLLEAGVYGVAFSGLLVGAADQAEVVRKLEAAYESVLLKS